MYWVYALKSNIQKYIYVGMTNDIDRRIAEHNAGRAKTTKPYAPFKLIYSETAGDRQSARKREKYLKSGIGKEFLKNL
ncbi:MAG: GIY-YIG nuclease family protein [bacterium]|nr:GIY-YIG nuclease family protein [bacterium]